LEELKWILLNGTCIFFLNGYDADFPKISKLSINFPFDKNLVESLYLRVVPRVFRQWIILLPPILVKQLFLYSVRTKFSEIDQLSKILRIFKVSFVIIFLANHCNCPELPCLTVIKLLCFWTFCSILQF
jgi:hypothetical protein